ncbi:MAG: ComEC/Rec2 family competence protein, partial [Fibrobacterales bacterium]|nr:ComEC/Rec2 family competence protein [Fibrobacterales bacterium]
VLLGKRDGLAEERSRDLRDAGLFHLFAISGMHLALLANVLLVLLRAAGLGARSCSGALIALLWTYSWLCGFPVSVRRAAVMATASLSGPWFARKSAPFHSLALACWILLLATPGDFASPAFFLSFGATAGIVAWNGKNSPAILPDNPLAAPLGISLSAFLATLPLLVLFFNQANPWTLLANLPACPLMAFFFGASLGAAVCAPWCAPLADAFGGSASCICEILVRIAGLAARAPFGKNSAAAWPLFAVVLWYAAYFAFSRWRSGPAARRVALVSTLLLLAWWAPRPVVRALFPEAEIDVIDVGQGDAILFTAPNGRSLLVDAGPGGPDGNRLVRHLQSRGGAPDLMIVTHPHADHWGGLPAMAQARLLPPEILVAQGTTKRPSRTYVKALDLARNDGARVDAVSEAVVSLDPTTRVRVRQPGRSASPVRSANDLTLVSEIGLGCEDDECEEWIVLTGDLENRPDLLYASRPPPGRVALLKVGHHGAKTATSDALLESLKPALAAISVGSGNKYRHPTPQALGRLARRGIPVARTDRQGTLRYHWRPGKRLSLSADR